MGQEIQMRVRQSPQQTRPLANEHIATLSDTLAQDQASGPTEIPFASQIDRDCQDALWIRKHDIPLGPVHTNMDAHRSHPLENEPSRTDGCAG